MFNQFIVSSSALEVLVSLKEDPMLQVEIEILDHTCGLVRVDNPSHIGYLLVGEYQEISTQVVAATVIEEERWDRDEITRYVCAFGVSLGLFLSVGYYAYGMWKDYGPKQFNTTGEWICPTPDVNDCHLEEVKLPQEQWEVDDYLNGR